jgi:hypothetical protein
MCLLDARLIQDVQFGIWGKRFSGDWVHVPRTRTAFSENREMLRVFMVTEYMYSGHVHRFKKSDMLSGRSAMIKGRFSGDQVHVPQIRTAFLEIVIMVEHDIFRTCSICTWYILYTQFLVHALFSSLHSKIFVQFCFQEKMMVSSLLK